MSLQVSMLHMLDCPVSVVSAGVSKCLCHLCRPQLSLQVSGICPHHVAIKGRCVFVHHEQQVVHGLMKGRDQSPHHAVQIVKLSLAIRHLSHHGPKPRPLQDKHRVDKTDVKRGRSLILIEKKKTHQSSDRCRNGSSSWCCCPSANAVDKLPQRQRYKPLLFL